MAQLSLSQVAPLLAALDFSSDKVRLAALRALVRLKLDPLALSELSEIVVGMLKREWRSEGLSPEEIVEAAVYVPTERVRRYLASIIEYDDALRSVVLRKLQSHPHQEPPSRLDVKRPPRNPELQVLAANVVRQMRQQGYLDQELSEKSFRADLISYLPSDLAADLVNALFKDAVEYALTMIDAPPGNEIVQNIALCERFTPDVRGLFPSYCRLWTSETVTQEFRQAWAVRWLIAWTVSRTQMGNVIEALAPILLEGTDRESELSARLIEDSVRYAKQEVPPQFGGGEEPADLIPPLSSVDALMEYISPSTRSPRPVNIEPPSPEPEPSSEPESGSSDVSFSLYPPPGYRDVESDEISEAESSIGDSESAGTLIAGGEGGSSSYFDELEDLELETKDEEGQDAAEPPRRVVNTGFTSGTEPDDLLEPSLPLAPDTEYFFWLDVGEPNKKSMELTKSDIPQATPGVSLTVTVVGFHDGMQVETGADVGQLYVKTDGTVKVEKQPLGDDAPESTASARRLFFPVRTPAVERIACMRCHIYYGRILLQSRLIEVHVSRSAITHINVPEFGCRSQLDYKLSQMLDPSLLNQLEPHRLSMMLNSNGNGTHSFHFFGGDENTTFKHDDVRFTEGTLTGLLKLARGTLRRVSWGSNDEWVEGTVYKYKDRQLNLPRLYSDLKNLARWGCEFYTKIKRTLAEEKFKELQQLMLKPGLVQIAMKESPSYVLPVALIYDYPLDTGAADYTYCPVFEDALKSHSPLNEVACFQGLCPVRGNLKAICPSGFWGFRHQLGMPLSLEDAPDVGPRIKVDESLNMTVAVATDMQLLGAHKERIAKLTPKPTVEYAESREVVFDLLKKSPHLVYFYCHGGYARESDAPYLKVGPKENPELILQSNLDNYDIVWDRPRPLVFINGCHTTALEPQQALNLVTPFVSDCHSVGVIGTEITIFEELATVFAEECLQRFLNNESIGESIRCARLKLLSEGNPLGLVYIPFVQADLKLEYAA